MIGERGVPMERWAMTQVDIAALANNRPSLPLKTDVVVVSMCRVQMPQRAPNSPFWRPEVFDTVLFEDFGLHSLWSDSTFMASKKAAASAAPAAEALQRQIVSTIKLVITAASAKPSPPVGPALGQAGLNIMSFW